MGSSSKIFWMTVSLVFSPAPDVMATHGAYPELELFCRPPSDF